MFEVRRCPVCRGERAAGLITCHGDPYLRRLSSRSNYDVHYVACRSCGFVYQPRMMDEREMDELYGGKYRPGAPSGDYLATNRSIALDVYSWIIERSGMRGAGRKVLDIGCATGMFLRPFAMNGWKAIGLDAGSSWVEYGRREFGLDLRSEFFTQNSFPGERFDLILFSHVIEHVLDPEPVLAAIREKLSDDGYVFIGTPNVLAPNRKLFPGLFGGDHVRLFSPRTLRIFLRRHGLRPVAIETHQPRGLRVLAVKAEQTDAPAVRDRDDWQAICALYNGLSRPGDASLFERNVAALVAGQEPVVEEVCRKREDGLYRVGFAGDEADNVEVRARDGSPAWLYGPAGSRANAARLTILGVRQSSATVILLGLGLGHLAQRLARELEPAEDLIIWEADAALFATALRVRDLSDLFAHPRVTLHVGPDMGRLQTMLSPRQGSLVIGPIMDARTAAFRHPLYEEFELQVKLRAEFARKRNEGASHPAMSAQVVG